MKNRQATLRKSAGIEPLTSKTFCVAACGKRSCHMGSVYFFAGANSQASPQGQNTTYKAATVEILQLPCFLQNKA